MKEPKLLLKPGEKDPRPILLIKQLMGFRLKILKQNRLSAVNSPHYKRSVSNMNSQAIMAMTVFSNPWNCKHFNNHGMILQEFSVLKRARHSSHLYVCN